MADATPGDSLRAATAALLQLARRTHVRGQGVDAALREVTEVATRGMACARSGVWLYDEGRTRLRLADLYDASTREHASGVDLTFTDHPIYFQALAAEHLLSVRDARRDPRTREFAATYFEPNGITSTLDAVVRLRGDVVGAICVEHRGPLRDWSVEEEVFTGALAETVSLILEAAERHRVESALHQSERRFQDLFAHTGDIIVLYRVDDSGAVLCEDINPAGERITGLKRETIVGRRTTEVLDPVSAAKLDERYAQCIAARAPITYEHELSLPAGTKHFSTALVPLFDEAGRVVRLASIVRDMTAHREGEALRRRLESQLADAQKNEALARLASHIAHDVNNLLTVITAHASRIDGPGKAADAAQAIQQATARGRELTQQVLAFGRRRPAEQKPVDVAALVHDVVQLLQGTAPHLRFVESKLGAPPLVMGEASQLLQMLTNLCTNAIQAMPTEGELTLATELVEVDDVFAARHPPLSAGRWVRLTVRDTGAGMDEATLRHIFEPFFTTRGDGRGTGLGLAVVHGVVSAHDGVVVVDSQVGRGSSFHVYLPPLEGEATGDGSHVMLVDDHPGMARVSAKLLETLGYRTSVFDDPREALKAFVESPLAYDVVLTDMSMPQMSGEDFARAVRARRPSIPILVSSGLAAELDESRLEAMGVSGVLLKPWRVEEAVALLQRALGRR